MNRDMLRTVVTLLATAAPASIVACTVDDGPYSYPTNTSSSSSSGGSSGTSGTTYGTSGDPQNYGTSSGASGTSGTSGYGTSSSSSSGTPVNPPPPPTTIAGGCTVNGAAAPAGAAPTDVKGDCYADTCDGVSKDSKHAWDATDVGKAPDECHVAVCDATKYQPATASAPNGTACQTDKICFGGNCLTCKPTNPTSCGTEGAYEPANNDAATAANYSEYSTVCAFSTGTDVDWYTFYAHDKDFSHDVFSFDVWSTAQNIEVCVYVKCVHGSPSGCNSIQTGPDGSQGCCWSGIPDTVHPYWDMDCSGTDEDSGTAYVSVKTPGGDACEPYLIRGGY